MAKYVGVRHEEESRVYWFGVKPSMKEAAKVGASVICDTKMGEMPGTIVKIMEGLGHSEETKIVPAKYFPLKMIVAIHSEFSLGEITIPFRMDINELPSPEEFAERVREFYTTGGFSGVLFDSCGTLLKGYSAYMVARMLGHDTLRGLIIDIERGSGQNGDLCDR